MQNNAFVRHRCTKFSPHFGILQFFKTWVELIILFIDGINLYAASANTPIIPIKVEGSLCSNNITNTITTKPKTDINTISNSKPKQSSIEANPSIKKFIEKHVISSIIEPIILVKQYKVTQISSDSSIKKNKLLGTIKKLKNNNQTIELKKTK